MSSPINREVVHSGADNTVIPMNRWGNTSYSVVDKVGTWKVEGTLDRVNQGETAVWNTLAGTIQPAGTTGSLAAIAGQDLYVINQRGLEAIRVTSTGAGTIKVMQQGEVN